MSTSIPRFMVAAPSSGSGKTVVTCALLRALARRGLACAAFKCGPDYIDPLFHRRVVGARSGNLDGFFTDAPTLRALGSHAAPRARMSRCSRGSWAFTTAWRRRGRREQLPGCARYANAGRFSGERARGVFIARRRNSRHCRVPALCERARRRAEQDEHRCLRLRGACDRKAHGRRGFGEYPRRLCVLARKPASGACDRRRGRAALRAHRQDGRAGGKERRRRSLARNSGDGTRYLRGTLPVGADRGSAAHRRRCA